MSKGVPPAISGCRTLTDLCRRRAALAPDRITYSFVADGETEGGRLTNADLDQKARAIAAFLQAHVGPGERALLVYPPGLDFIPAFFGCLYAGVLAVPVYPPNPARLARTLPRLQAIVADARPAVALTTAEIAGGIEGAFALAPDLASMRWLATDTVPADAAGAWRDPGVSPHDVAFLQYTSGSTAAPKGVMLTHANLLHNQEVIRDTFRTREESVSVNWLPIYHDMGLIGQVLQPLYVGGRVVLMSPLSFLKRPVRWLAAMSRYGGTHSAGPNFAYDLCVRRIPPAEREGLDLRSWEAALNGAEPISFETLERFATAFAPAGFRWRALRPCYGMAEATLCVSGGRRRGAGPRVVAFDDAALRAHAVVEAAGGTDRVRLVGCGHPGPGITLAIVDPQSGRRARPGQVGEIWVAGASVAAGYWDRPQETETAFRAVLADGGGEGPFLRTGDLGFVHDGELFVTGREKDLIIVRGRNHYPQDIERSVGRSHPALRSGCGVAFSVEAGGEERLVVAHELERGHQRADADEVAGAIRRAVVQGHELQVHSVVLLRPSTLPKTSSGKVQRRACRDLFLSGGLDLLGEWRTGVLPTARPGAVPHGATLPPATARAEA